MSLVLSRKQRTNTTPQRDEASVATRSVRNTERFTQIAPSIAPAKSANTEAVRRCHLGLEPPAREESAAIPVIVNVSTVVVRSGIASFLTPAFRIPIATDVRTIIEYNWCPSAADTW